MRPLAGSTGGFVTVQFVVAVACSLLLLVLVGNALVAAYARGVVRAALDEGARAGARVEAPADTCVERATAVLDDLLRGALRADVGAVACRTSGGRLHAAAPVTSRAWLPALPGWAYEAAAVATLEQGE